MKNTARNKQIVFFAESRKTVKLKLFLEKAKKGHSGEFLDILMLEGTFKACRGRHNMDLAAQQRTALENFDPTTQTYSHSVSSAGNLSKNKS